VRLYNFVFFLALIYTSLSLANGPRTLGILACVKSNSCHGATIQRRMQSLSTLYWRVLSGYDLIHMYLVSIVNAINFVGLWAHIY
jgi:hypothetical protein